MAKHTPLPWKWDEPSNWLGTAARIYHKSGDAFDPIAQVQLSGWPKRVGLANAAIIVTAVNAHDVLLAALKRAHELLVENMQLDLGFDKRTRAEIIDGHPDIVSIRAAIAKGEPHQ